MITKNSAGTPLGNAFIFNSMYRRVLNEDESPIEQIYFARKITSNGETNWVRRNVSSMFVDSSPITKTIAGNYGTSTGTDVELVFDNTPLPVLYSVLTINNKIRSFVVKNDPRVMFVRGDWIEISDYENVEYRRIVSVVPIEDNKYLRIEISIPLDNDYIINNTEMRFAFVKTLFNKDRLESSDFFNGWIQMNLGFANRGDFITLFQGEIIGGARDPNNTITLTAHDRVKSLVETQLSARFEVDDRGVASVPTACGWNGEETKKLVSTQVFGNTGVEDGPNVGTGEISDISYSDNKFNEISVDQTWSFTYQAKRNTFHEWGSRIVSGQGDKELGTLSSTGYAPEGNTGNQTWTINLTDEYGWSVTISEGDIPFEDGDQFAMYTHKYIEGRSFIVKGRGFEETPVLQVESKHLTPSYVIESLITEVLDLKHENFGSPDITALETNLLVGLEEIRQLDSDFRTELRGFFEEGTSAIEIIDDALRCVNGWMYSTHDDHLRLFYYTPFAYHKYTNFEIVSDFDSHRSGSRYPNAADPQSEPRMVDSIKNQMVFTHSTGRIFIEDTDSQENFGKFKLDVRGEDLITHDISTGFEITNNTARNAGYRALNRYKDPIFRGSFVGMPSTLLLEIGDIPIVYARDVRFVAQPLWVTGIEVDYTNLTTKITGEIATQVSGKYGEAHPDDDVQSTDLWSADGYIGDDEQERLAFLAHDEQQLDAIKWPHDNTYQPRVGKPDRWDNYVEDAFIVG